MSKKSCKIYNRQDFCHQDGNSYEKIQIEACNTRILCLFNEAKENFMIQMDVINSHSKQSCGCLITTEEVGLIISTGANFSIVIGIVRHKINLTWNCGIKFFSLQIPVC